MGKIAVGTPSTVFSSTQCKLLTKYQIFPPSGTFKTAGKSVWSTPGYNHRTILIDHCLVPVLKPIIPLANLAKVLHSMTNTDIINLAVHLAPSRKLEHIIKLGIICRATEPADLVYADKLVEILTMTTTDALIYVADLNDVFRKVLPDLLQHIRNIDSSYQEGAKQPMLFGDIAYKTPEQIESMFRDVLIQKDQMLYILGHESGYGTELMSLQEKVQFLIDTQVLNFFNKGNGASLPKFLDWFDRAGYLGRTDAFVYSIPHMMTNMQAIDAGIRVDESKLPKKGVVAVEKQISDTKHCAIQGMDNLFLNLRLALMATNTIEREVLVRADNETLLRLAAESIDPSSADITSFTPFYTYGDVGYSRSACIEIIHKNFDTSYKELALLSDTEITDYMNSHFANEDDDDDDELDRDEMIELLAEAGHKKAKLKKLEDAELSALVDKLFADIDSDEDED